jgi:hypothetical protein
MALACGQVDVEHVDLVVPSLDRAIGADQQRTVGVEAVLALDQG